MLSDTFYDLPERIADAFPEIDSDIVTDMLEHNEEYAKMRKQIDTMQRENPFIVAVTEGEAAVSLSAEEHKILADYFNLYVEMTNMERQQIYFRGHTDSFAYLKKMGVI